MKKAERNRATFIARSCVDFCENVLYCLQKLDFNRKV